MEELRERNEKLKLIAQNKALERQLGLNTVEKPEAKTFGEAWNNYKAERNRPKTKEELEEANLRSNTRFNNFFAGWTVVDGLFKVVYMVASVARMFGGRD